MAKKRKDGKVFNCYLTTQIYDLLHDYSIKNGYTMTMIMEKAIEYYLKNKKADEYQITEFPVLAIFYLITSVLKTTIIYCRHIVVLGNTIS